MSQATHDAQAVQDRIRDLQEALHRDVSAVQSKYNMQKNDVLAERDAHVRRLIEDGVLPSHFWADCIVAALQRKDAAAATASDGRNNDNDKDNDNNDDDDAMPAFLGPYDAELLRGYLRDVQLRYTAGGYRLTLRFATNPYFAETEVWAECVDDDDDGGGDAKKNAANGDGDDDDDDDSAALDRRWTFSGVTWHDGYGPEHDDDDDDDDKSTDGGATTTSPGSKRERAATPHDANDASSKAAKHDGRVDADTTTAAARTPQRGPSMLEAFSTMPPHPEADDELADEDEDELAEMVEVWETEMVERETLMQRLTQDVLHDPLRWWRPSAAAAASTTSGDNKNGSSSDGATRS